MLAEAMHALQGILKSERWTYARVIGGDICMSDGSGTEASELQTDADDCCNTALAIIDDWIPEHRARPDTDLLANQMPER